MREWLSGRALPCQGRYRGSESRLPLHASLSQDSEAFYIRNSDPRGSREPPNPVLAHDLLLQDSEAFYIRNSDPRGSREPPNPVLAHDLLLPGSGVFTSVIGVKFDTITLEKRKT